MDLIREQRIRTIKMTVLHRPGGQWWTEEVARLTNGLMTEVSSHPRHPEDLILLGHYTKEQTLRAIGGGVAYTATPMTGTKELPFMPGFF